MPKKKEIKLPNRLIGLGNRDKGFHEHWYKGRNMLNIPHPWRAVLLGPPNVGKTTVIKNLILRAQPEFQEIFVIHCDVDGTHEYDDLDCEMLSEIPDPASWEGEVKTLVICDDIPLKEMAKDQKSNLDRLFGYVSTHKNISVALTSQDTFNVPPSVRRCANIFVMWKMVDIDSLATTARKSGLKSNSMYSIFSQLMTGSKDSLWLDLTTDSPYPMRKNGFEIISKHDGEDTKRMEAKSDTYNILQ